MRIPHEQTAILEMKLLTKQLRLALVERSLAALDGRERAARGQVRRRRSGAAHASLPTDFSSRAQASSPYLPFHSL